MQRGSFPLPCQQLLAFSLMQGQTTFASVLTASRPPQPEALTSKIEWNRTEISASVLLMAMAFLFLMCCAAIALMVIICCSFKRADAENSGRNSPRLTNVGIVDCIPTPDYRFESLHIAPLSDDDMSKKKYLIEMPNSEPTPNGSPISNHDAELNIVRFHEEGSLNNYCGLYNQKKEYTDEVTLSSSESTYKNHYHKMELTQDRPTTRLNGNENNLQDLRNEVSLSNCDEQTRQSHFRSLLNSIITFSQKTYEPLKNKELELRFVRSAAS